MIKLEYSGPSALDNSITLEFIECPRCDGVILFDNVNYKACPYCWKVLPPVRFMLDDIIPRIAYYNNDEPKTGVIHE